MNMDRTHRDRVSGFTLVELMVSSGILAVLILAFGLIMTKSKELVTSANRSQRLNTTETALSRQLGTDLLTVPKSGFLKITQNAIVMISVGKYNDLDASGDSTRSNLSRITYTSFPTGDGCDALLRISEPIEVDTDEYSKLYEYFLDPPTDPDAADPGSILGGGVQIPPRNYGEIMDTRYVIVEQCKQLDNKPYFAPAWAGNATGTTYNLKTEDTPQAVKVALTVVEVTVQGVESGRDIEIYCPVSIWK